MQINKYIEEQLYNPPKFEFEGWGDIDAGMEEEYDSQSNMNEIFKFLEEIYKRGANDDSLEQDFSYTKIYQTVNDLIENNFQEVILEKFNAFYTGIFTQFLESATE